MHPVIEEINGHLLTRDPRSKISGQAPVRLSRRDPASGRLTPVAMYLPKAVATSIGVGAKLTGYEVRIGSLNTAKRDALACTI